MLVRIVAVLGTFQGVEGNIFIADGVEIILSQTGRHTILWYDLYS